MRETNRVLRRGQRVRVWTGEKGWVRYVTYDGWVGVRLDGEKRVDEWQLKQVEEVAA